MTNVSKRTIDTLSTCRKLYLSNSAAPKEILGKEFILFAGIDAGLKPHFMAHCVLARTLRMMGHPVVMLKCYKQFNRCTVLEGRTQQETLKGKTRICLECATNCFKGLEEYDLPSLDLKDIEVDMQLLPSSLEIESKLIDYAYEDIPFGKICLTDVLRNYKISNFDLVLTEKKQILIEYIQDAILFYLKVEKIKSLYKIKSFIYFGDYSLFVPVIYKCRQEGIRFSTLHQPALFYISRNKVVIDNELWGISIKKLFNTFNKWKDLPLSLKTIQEIGDDVFYKLDNKDSKVYSPSKTLNNDLFTQFNIDRNKKILVAYTSSMDEIEALVCQYQALGLELLSSKQPFKDQIDWLQQLINFVLKEKEYFLIIRIHPREGGTKDGIPSEHFQKLKQQFSQDFERVKIIWPADVVSSYDLAEIASLVLISWSSIGSELSRLGVPVVSAFNIDWSYPNHQFLKSEDYFKTLIQMLDKETTLEDVRNAFHWFYVRILSKAIDISDVVPSSHFWGLPPRFETLPKHSKMLEAALIHHNDVDELKTNEAKAASLNLDEQLKVEKIELLTYVNKYIYFLLFGKMELSSINLKSIDLKEKYPYVQYKDENNNRVEKYSPMTARLAKMALNSEDLLENEKMT